MDTDAETKKQKTIKQQFKAPVRNKKTVKTKSENNSNNIRK